jgi:hypothetical protein
MQANGSNSATTESSDTERSDANGSGPVEEQHEESNASNENSDHTPADGAGISADNPRIDVPTNIQEGRSNVAVNQLQSSYSQLPASSHNDLTTFLSDAAGDLINNVISAQTYVGSMTNGDGTSLGKLVVAAAVAGSVSALGVGTLAWTVRSLKF